MASNTSISGADLPTYVPSLAIGPGWDSPLQVHAAAKKDTWAYYAVNIGKGTHKAFVLADTTNIMGHRK